MRLYVKSENSKIQNDALPEIEHGLKKIQGQVPKQDVNNILINICFLRFQTYNYPALIDALSNAFSAIGRDEKMHLVLRDLKFLEIMAHFSLKNYDLLEYQIRNTERWLREHKLHENFTEVLLRSFPLMRIEPKYHEIKNQLQELPCANNLQVLKMLVLEWMGVNPPVIKASKVAKVSVSQRSRYSQH